MEMVMISHPDYASDFYMPFYVAINPSRLSRSGYGKGLPTPYMINFEGRKRRIYSTCYSNCARLYIVVKGKKVTVL